MSSNISDFYQLHRRLERNKKAKKESAANRPCLMFSDYLHMEDDEHFAFRALKGLANLVCMNIVVMYYLKGFVPDDYKNVGEKRYWSTPKV